MGQQLLFCIEADSKSKTDWVYIKATIERFYKLPNTVSVKPICMGGKTNYKRNRVIKDIKNAVNGFKNSGNTHVIYCIDTDNINSDPNREREFKEITDYCAEKKYKLIWFCRDVEEVYLGKHSEQSAKIDAAKKFKSSDAIMACSEKALACKQPSIKRSNILIVLDDYLERI